MLTQRECAVRRRSLRRSRGIHFRVSDILVLGGAQVSKRRFYQMQSYRIKLIKSLAGRHDKHIATAESLGLKKIGDETLQPDNPQTRGKLEQIKYLITVMEE